MANASPSKKRFLVVKADNVLESRIRGTPECCCFVLKKGIVRALEYCKKGQREGRRISWGNQVDPIPPIRFLNSNTIWRHNLICTIPVHFSHHQSRSAMFFNWAVANALVQGQI